MKRVWQTADGKIFTDQLDAAKHEKEMMQGITMWDWDGTYTTDCSNAMIIRLVGENAAHNFKLINNNDCPSVLVSDASIKDGEEGIWFWDEYTEQYVPIVSQVLKALTKVFNEIG